MAMHVLVVGAGLSGLCLAHGLRRAGIDVDIFDAELSPFVSHGQSYRLTIDADGSRALEACLPPALYDLATATSGQREDALTVYNDRREVLERVDLPHPRRLNGDGNGHMPVDRFTLRQILLGHLDTHLHFQKGFVRYDTHPDGVVAHFDDGTQYEGDLLVGGDGIGSRVRGQLLPAATVTDMGVRAIFGRTPLLTRGDEILDHTLIGDDFVAVASHGHALVGAPMRFREAPQIAAARLVPDVPLAMRDDYVAWAVLFPAGDFDESPTDTNVLQDEAALQARRFPAKFSQVVAEGDPTDTVLVPIRVAAPVAEWETTRVTLMGDAIHAMPALGTHDVNMALHDASLLTDHLAAAARGDRDLVSAVHEYERVMRRDGFSTAQRAEAELRQIVGG